MKIVMSAYLSENKPIVIKFGTLFSTESIVTKNQILVFKMADGRHIWKHCLWPSLDSALAIFSRNFL